MKRLWIYLLALPVVAMVVFVATCLATCLRYLFGPE